MLINAPTPPPAGRQERPRQPPFPAGARQPGGAGARPPSGALRRAPHSDPRRAPRHPPPRPHLPQPLEPQRLPRPHLVPVRPSGGLLPPDVFVSLSDVGSRSYFFVFARDEACASLCLWMCVCAWYRHMRRHIISAHTQARPPARPPAPTHARRHAHTHPHTQLYVYSVTPSGPTSVRLVSAQDPHPSIRLEGQKHRGRAVCGPQ